jgi:hypothetical protein
MGQLSNVRRIIVEDFAEEDRDAVGKIATVFNSFADEVVELTRKKINFDNLARSLVTIDITVDADGIPKGVSQINTTLSTFSGKNIVHVQSLAGGANVVSTPYLDCTYQGNGIVRIVKFYGLPPNKKLRISIEFIA